MGAPASAGQKVGMMVFVTLNLFWAGMTIRGYRDPSSSSGLVERGIRAGPFRGERLGTKLMVFALAVGGAAVWMKRRPLGFGLVGASYVVDAARMEVFHVREGGRPFDAEYMAPWMMMMVGLFFTGVAVLAARRDAPPPLHEDVDTSPRTPP